MSSPPSLGDGWAKHRQTIKDLYWNENKTLTEVMAIMSEKHGFVALKKQYKKHFIEWGLEKNAKTYEMQAMVEIQSSRRDMLNKETQFFVRGREVKLSNLTRFKRKNVLNGVGWAGSLSPDSRAAPRGITYGTPEPEESQHTSTPPAQVFAVGRDDARVHAYLATNAQTITRPTNFPAGFYFSQQFQPIDASSASPSNLSFQDLPTIHSAPFDYSLHRRLVVGPGTSLYDINQVHTAPSSAAMYNTALQSALPADGLSRFEGQSGANMVGTGDDWGYGSGSIRATASEDNNEYLGDSLASQSSSPWIENCDLRHPQARFNIDPRLRSSLELLTPLHVAVIGGDITESQAILDGGADVDATGIGGVAPLHYAAFQRNVALVNLLKSYGAKLDATTNLDRSVLFYAVCKEPHLADSDKAIYGRHYLMEKVSRNNMSAAHTDDNTMDVVEALFGLPSGWFRLLNSLSQPDNAGVTPLMVAAQAGFTSTVTMFLQRGACPSTKDHGGYTALKYAASSRHDHLVRLLLQADGRVQVHGLDHLLKLAVWNLTADDDSVRIAAEMARLCRDMGMLDGLITLASKKGEARVVHFLTEAKNNTKGPAGSGSQ
ncbi:ankyrin repeat-containing domain protein [Lasiosphaeria miniovina]|uniref:Ankyrin repeat-containing domain protein n=1 Tax=Lasiosphaeria miniovina TaxID=1954250 RepID=A0AA40DKC4_9PEZI|nr:ankyrin repeat-containing domain protein [Lasiosphaeria miniovina]KAK0703987.1 ankyrin repeat-containing domain protein [Lasiosphaeria miniovina]